MMEYLPAKITAVDSFEDIRRKKKLAKDAEMFFQECLREQLNPILDKIHQKMIDDENINGDL